MWLDLCGELIIPCGQSTFWSERESRCDNFLRARSAAAGSVSRISEIRICPWADTYVSQEIWNMDPAAAEHDAVSGAGHSSSPDTDIGPVWLPFTLHSWWSISAIRRDQENFPTFPQWPISAIEGVSTPSRCPKSGTKRVVNPPDDRSRASGGGEG
jgi:hypothetical protein